MTSYDTNDIAEYKTISTASADSLDRKVNEKIGEGWMIYGNPYGTKDHCCQAMIKLKEKEKYMM